MSATGPHRRTLFEHYFYRAVRALARLVGVTCFDLRCVGRQHLHFDGPALLLSTHQSTLDPVLIGLLTDEEMAYLARKTLFNSFLFAKVIKALNAIEIDREGGGLAGLKETLRRLKQGKKVLIFPEGTRTSTGVPAPLKPGFISLARRGSIPLVPIAVTGAFQALQRGSRWPRYAPLCVVVSEPIPPQLVSQLDDEELLAEIQRRLQACHQQAIQETEFAVGVRLKGVATSTDRL
jgi:1-acyl-sn-glycerol-3-phosphate acyltransferase